MDQKKLSSALNGVVEDSVNEVGVYLNSASYSLLKYVSGIGTSLAKGIVDYRNENGPFKTRKDLHKVPKLGPKAFEQCAGFLRIADGYPLDNTAVHPESYPVTLALLKELGLSLEELGTPKASLVLSSIKDLQGLSLKLNVGKETLSDIVSELQKPGRDPREEAHSATLDNQAKDIKDLRPGMVSAHPFSNDNHQFDARLTTKYLVEDWRSNVFTCLHEGGHCLEFQNKPQAMYDNHVESLASAAICETHSRFYENLIGRSREFMPILKKACSETLDPGFDYMNEEDFYHLINKIEPWLIRCEADELSYCLHIIIRYEIEKDLINGKIECKDVPAIWNQKYHDYLGVDVPNDKDGCMPRQSRLRF